MPSHKFALFTIFFHLFKIFYIFLRNFCICSYNLIPIKKPDGDLRSLVLTIFNVTAQKKIEEEFLKEKEFTETALNAQRDTFFVFDLTTGKTVRWNKEFKEISGYSDEEISNLIAPESYYREDELKQLIKAPACAQFALN